MRVTVGMSELVDKRISKLCNIRAGLALAGPLIAKTIIIPVATSNF